MAQCCTQTICTEKVGLLFVYCYCCCRLQKLAWSVVLEHFGWQEKTNQKCNLEFYQKNISGLKQTSMMIEKMLFLFFVTKGYHNNAIVEKLLPKSLFPEIDDIYKVAELKEDLFRMAFKRWFEICESCFLLIYSIV
jgi:hypothetical protein